MLTIAVSHCRSAAPHVPAVPATLSRQAAQRVDRQYPHGSLIGGKLGLEHSDAALDTEDLALKSCRVAQHAASTAALKRHGSAQR